MLQSHLTCWAKDSITSHGDSTLLVPISAACPLCKKQTLWGDIIRHKLKFSDLLQKRVKLEKKELSNNNKTDNFNDSLGDLLMILDRDS